MALRAHHRRLQGVQRLVAAVLPYVQNLSPELPWALCQDARMVYLGELHTPILRYSYAPYRLTL